MNSKLSAGKTVTPIKWMFVNLTKRSFSNVVKLRPNSFKSCGELIPTPDLNTLTPVTDLVSQIHPAEETQLISGNPAVAFGSGICTHSLIV